MKGQFYYQNELKSIQVAVSIEVRKIPNDPKCLNRKFSITKKLESGRPTINCI